MEPSLSLVAGLAASLGGQKSEATPLRDGETKSNALRSPKSVPAGAAGITLADVTAAYKSVQRSSVLFIIKLGHLSDRWLREQGDRPANERLPRPAAMAVMRERLAAAKVEKKEARVDLYIRCYHAARIFSGLDPRDESTHEDVKNLSFSALRLFPIFLRRLKDSEVWLLNDDHAQAARDLWKRAVDDRMPADMIDAEISRILPARTLEMKKARPMPLETLVEHARRLPPAEVASLVEQLQAIRQANRDAA